MNRKYSVHTNKFGYALRCLIVFGFAACFNSVFFCAPLLALDKKVEEHRRGFTPVAKPKRARPLAIAGRGQRKALVIGNSAYLYVDKLPNTQNDAKDIHEALSKLGFQTKLVLNANLRELRDAFKQFITRANEQDILFVFYAGHAFQYKNANLIAPIDMRINTKTRQIDKIFNLSVMFRKLVKASKTRIMFLDACRNDPTSTTDITVAGNRNAGGIASPPPVVTRAITTRAILGYQNGFGQMKGSEPGTFIAYSTASGSVASDGLHRSSRNSPFTKSLLKYVSKPKLNISDLLRNVRGDVYRETSELESPQLPWNESSLVEPFFFVDHSWQKWMIGQLQDELRLAGCYTGKSDGKWGRGSKSALGRFNQISSKKFPVDRPSLATLDQLRGVRNTFRCPTVKAPKVNKISRLNRKSTTSKRVKAKSTTSKRQTVKRKTVSPPPSVSGGFGAGSF